MGVCGAGAAVSEIQPYLEGGIEAAALPGGGAGTVCPGFVGAGDPAYRGRPVGATALCQRWQSCVEPLKTCMKSGQFGGQLDGKIFAIDMDREVACLDGVVPQNLVVDPTEPNGVFKGLPRSVGLKPFLTSQPLEVFPRHFLAELKTQDGRIAISIGSRQLPCSQRLAPSTNDCLEIIPLLLRPSHRRVLRYAGALELERPHPPC